MTCLLCILPKQLFQTMSVKYEMRFPLIAWTTGNDQKLVRDTYPDEEKTQGDRTRTNLKRHLTFIKKTQTGWDRAWKLTLTHTPNKTEESHWLQWKYSHQWPLPQMSSFYDVVKRTCSLLCARIVFGNRIILTCKARSEQPNKTAQCTAVFMKQLV